MDGYGLAIVNICRSAADDFIQGRRDVENNTDWSNYLADLEAAELKEVLDLMQTVYDSRWQGLLPDLYVPKP
jgi:hypothetical protein